MTMSPVRRLLNRRALPIVILGAVLLLLAVASNGVRLYADWLWFREIGFLRVFATELGTRVVLLLGVLVAAFAFLAANVRYAQRGVVPYPLHIRLTPEMPPVQVPNTVQKLALPVAAILAFILAAGTSRAWMVAQQLVHRVPFGVTDPVFGRDIGFYVFTLPAIATGVGLLLTLVVMALLLTVPLYMLRGDLIVQPRVRLERSAGMHLGVLVALLFTAIALRIWFVNIPELLYSTTGPLLGASYTDLHARLPALRVLAVGALVAAGLTIYGAIRQRLAL